MQTPQAESKSENAPVPKSAARPVKRYPGKEAFAIPSITNALKDEVVEKKNENNAKIVEPLANSVPSKSFTPDQLTAAWRSFVEAIDAPQLKSALSSHEPQLLENWKIAYELDNEVQNQRISLELKPQLLGFLRNTLENELIEIDFTVSENIQSELSVPYTDNEKWQVLTEKYPALAMLKIKFGLDFQ